MPKRKPEDQFSPRSHNHHHPYSGGGRPVNNSPRSVKLESEDNVSDDMSLKTHCSCKRTSCLKSYCECFKRGDVCSPECNCQNCKNVAGSEERKRINEQKAKLQFKKLFKARPNPLEHTNEQYSERINRLRQWLTNDAIREFGIRLLKDIQREEKTFHKQYQFMLQHQQHKQKDSTFHDDVSIGVGVNPNSGNSVPNPTISVTPNGDGPTTPTTPTNTQESVSPDTLSLFCDETDAVQAASRPKLSRTPSHGAILRTQKISQSTLEPEFDRDAELISVLEKKVLITFKKRLSSILMEE